MEFLFQRGAGGGDLGEELFVFGQEVVHVAGAGVGVVRVLEVEVEVAGLDGVDGDAPSLLVFHAGFEAVGLISPPGFDGIEFLNADGLTLVVALGAGRIGVLVIPDVGGGRAFGEEEEVGADAGVGIEDAVGQADDGVQIALGEQGFLDAGFDAFAEERAIRQHESGAAAGLEDLHEEHEEEVGGLAGAELGGVVGLDAVLLHATERRVGDDAVHALLRAPVAQGTGEGVVVADVGGDVDAVQEEIGHAQDVREVLLLDAGEAVLNFPLVGLGLRLFAQVLDGADEEAAGAAGGIEDGLAKAGVDLLHDELGDGARGVELAGVARGLEVLEELLVDVAEHVAVIRGVEVDAVDLVDDLAHQRAVLHVVVGVVKGRADEAGDLVATAGEGLELREERVVDEVEERVASDAFVVNSPIGPAQSFRQRRFVIVAEEFHLLLAVVEDLEEEHPAELFETLGIAVGAGILAHDVLDGFDDVGDVCHGFNVFSRRR